MIYRRGLLWTLLLLAANGLLLWGIVQVWWGNDTGPARPGAKPGLEVPKAPVLRDQQPLSAFRVISAKNLFSQDRTGPEPGLSLAQGQASLEGRRLLGIIIIGDDKAALIGTQQAGPRGPGRQPQVEVVRLGEQWGGFQVVEISSEAVVFEGKDGKKTLNFPD